MFQMMMFLFVALVIAIVAVIGYGMYRFFNYISGLDIEGHRKLGFLTIIFCCVIMVICTVVIVLN